MVLDLRFIPEDMTFERKLRDEARAVPPKYKLPSFAASALQNSTVPASSHPANPNPNPNQVTSFEQMCDLEHMRVLAAAAPPLLPPGVRPPCHQHACSPTHPAALPSAVS